MKWILILCSLLFTFQSGELFSQSCSGFNPNQCTKNILVYIHYVQRSDGSGNFGEINDGYGGSSVTGYTWSRDLINKANEQLENLQPNEQSPSGSAHYTNARFRYVLAGVNFIKSDDFYRIDNFFERRSSAIHNTHGVEKDKFLNVYIYSEYYLPINSGGGIAVGRNFVNLHDYEWYKYNAFNNEEWIIRNQAALLNHEIGHVFSLDHDFLSFGVLCDMIDHRSSNSNNIMGSGINQRSWSPSFTPAQLEKAHNSLNSSKSKHVLDCNSNCLPSYTSARLFNNTSPFFPFQADVTLATATLGYSKYFVEIFETNGNNSNFVVSGTYLSSWYLNQPFLGHKSLRQRTYYDFKPNKWYRVKFVAQSSCDGRWDEVVNWVYTSPFNFLQEEEKQVLKSNVNIEPEIRIIQNPVQEAVRLSATGLEIENTSFHIISTDGRIVLSGKLLDSTIDVSDLLPGHYFVRVDPALYDKALRFLKI